MNTLTPRCSKPRIVIYGPGQFGSYIVRFAVQKGWTVVAAFNRAGTKVGQDIGRLAGVGRDLGVIVQDEATADFAALDADIAVVTSGINFLTYNLPIYRRLLGAGLNVVCHSTEAYYPYGNDPVIAAEIDTLAKMNNVTFSGGGIWDASRIWPGIVVTGQCIELKSLTHKSTSDCARGGKAAMLEAGVGISVEAFQKDWSGKGRKGSVAHIYSTVLQQVLAAVGFTVTKTTVRVEPVLYDKPIPCPLLGRDIPPGECAGSLAISDVETKEGVTARGENDARLYWPGEVGEQMKWIVDGRPVARITMEREDNAYATAACLFNRIPDVIAAPPGIVTCGQLGPMKHTVLQH